LPIYTRRGTEPLGRTSLGFAHGLWLWPYLAGMGVLSYLSSFDTKTPSSPLGLAGPKNILTFGWDIVAVAVFSLIIYAIAIRLRLSPERSHEYVGNFEAEATEEQRAGTG
jgi:hypothetical protein